MPPFPVPDTGAGRSPSQTLDSVPERVPSIALSRPVSPVPSTALVRQLSGWLPAGPDTARQDVAERLGQWLNVAEAIELRAAGPALAQAARRSGASPAPGARQRLHEQLQAELERVRAVLGRSILARDPAHRPDPCDPDVELALWHQRLNDVQRRMEMSVDALRQHVRQQLGAGGPALARLAALDAVMDRLYAGREQRLLAGLPAFLKARFAALRGAAATEDRAGGRHWLDTFNEEFEQLLLAELDLRLLPVVGLIESLDP
ncbi:MAG: DUF3348 family protein [Burkholderiales bacterium]|nr:MAG: DUF3348 family protein [Burkholderiales bacterium]